MWSRKAGKAWSRRIARGIVKCIAAGYAVNLGKIICYSVKRRKLYGAAAQSTADSLWLKVAILLRDAGIPYWSQAAA